MSRNLPLNVYFSLVTAVVQGNSKTRAVGFEIPTMPRITLTKVQSKYVRTTMSVSMQCHATCH